KKVDIDGVIDSQYLISFLEERKGSILKQVGKTEKPDIAVAKMLEGRIVILVDGTPIVLTLPFIFFEDLQNSDDYYQRSFRVSIKRFLRVVGLLFSILLPGGYVAIQLYHYRIVPLKFLVTIINSTQGIPFTPFLEMLFVIVLFEILFEASLRMPKYLGIAISIVGALVLGDIAVKAGLISSPAVMIIALTGISFYVVPEQASQLSVIRLLFTLLGGAFGIIGISLGSVFLLTYLVEFNAYGSPYLAPYSPYIKNDLKDGVFKKQTVALNTRPESIPNQKIIRKK
ncbi:MAG: spore germination protein, partial [Clostridia bacterium]|nr:spore germination protein [Clostridia bacterium]